MTTDKTEQTLKLARHILYEYKVNPIYLVLSGFGIICSGLAFKLLGYTTGLTFHPWFNDPMPFSLIITMIYFIVIVRSP